jgi:effector-binding domain-containing protein
VNELTVGARLTAVIAETTTWERFPALWRQLLDEVWAAVRGSDVIRPGRNVMLYKDDVPRVEIGVEAAAAFAPIGRVVSSTLPAGRVITSTHRGPFEEVGVTHEALIAACAARGLRRLGPRWEIYGHWDESDPKPEVEVYYLVG